MSGAGPGRAIRVILAITLAGGLLGLLASAALASDPAWTRWTVSQLTADPRASDLFRATMVGLGACLGALAWLAMRLVGRLRIAGQATAGAWLLPVALSAAALGFGGVATFPVDEAPLVTLAHGTSAYTIPVAGLTLMLGARLVVPALGDRFGRTSLLAIAFVLLLYVTAIAGVVAYALMELAAFGMFGAWLAWLMLRLERIAFVSPTR